MTTFPTLCPDLQEIYLCPLPRDRMTIPAVSDMLLACNPNTLRCINVDYPLTEEAREVVFKLPDLHELTAVIERDTSLPLAVLPNLTRLTIECDCDLLRMFHGATFGELELVILDFRSEMVGNILEAFEKIALAASIQNTLSTFCLYTPHSWNPNYSSLLRFTQLTFIIIKFPCDEVCSSTVDDNIIMSLARTMPKLEVLLLGDAPCHEIPIGITVKGLVALAHRCANLRSLRVHFQVTSLTALPTVTSSARSTAPRSDCALTDFDAGEIPMPGESMLVVALTLALIFPHINSITYTDMNWRDVLYAIRLSREIVDYSSKEHTFSTPWSNFSDTSPGATLADGN